MKMLVAVVTELQDAVGKDRDRLAIINDALCKEIDALKATGIERERQAIKDRARLQGKVIPLSALPGADGKGGLDNGALGKLVDELPVTVPMDQRTPENLKALAAIGLGGGSTGADETVRVAMGISKETWDKHNKQ
jgi:hypothetical protein